MRFVARRALTSLIAVAGVSVLVFLLIHLIPGDPVDNLLGEGADLADKAAMRACMDLDQTLLVQFGRFLRSIFDGTLGRTCPDQKRTIAQLIGAAMPSTVILALAGMLSAIVMALPLGIVAALRRGTIADLFATTVSLAGVSVPTMWMGPMLILLFYVRLGWLPGPLEAQQPAALVLPAFVLGSHLMALLARMTRSSLVDVLGEDYIRTAYAKGLGESRVVFRHALRNALVPVITVAAMQFGSLLSGAVIVEKIFGRAGLGTLLLDGILKRDFRVVQGCTLVIALIYVTVNLLVDLLYAATDPRVRLSS